MQRTRTTLLSPYSLTMRKFLLNTKMVETSLAITKMHTEGEDVEDEDAEYSGLQALACGLFSSQIQPTAFN